MPSGIFITTDVPDNRLAQVLAGYRLQNPTILEILAQPNGLWTVRATWGPVTVNPPPHSAGPIPSP